MLDASEILGERILLRHARPEDLVSIYQNVWSDAEQLATTYFMVSDSLESAAERMGRTIAYQSGKPIYFVVLRDTGEAIGLAGMMEEDPGIVSEAGIVIGRRFQRQGYASEALSLLLKRAFDDPATNAFAYYCMDFNDRSRNLALKFGFRYDSNCEEVRGYDQKPFTLERYLLTREEFLG